MTDLPPEQILQMAIDLCNKQLARSDLDSDVRKVWRERLERLTGANPNLDFAFKILWRNNLLPNANARRRQKEGEYRRKRNQ